MKTVLVALILGVSAAHASATPIEIVMAWLTCDNAGRHRRDDVYVLVAERERSGEPVGWRLPADAPNQPQGHWTMSASGTATNAKSGASRYIKNQTLYRADLMPGEFHDVLFVFMKDDGETTIPAQELAAHLLEIVDDPVRADFGLILGALRSAGVTTEKGSNNYIGSFAAHIEINEGGEKIVRWIAKERVYDTLTYRNGYEFFMEGGASEYKAQVYWR